MWKTGQGTDMRTDPFDLRGKVAAIVGGARDLGFDMARTLAAAGADLFITSRVLEHAEKAAARIQSLYGVKAFPHAIEVTKHSEVEAAAREAAGWQGRIDILINNAGGGLGLKPTGFFERRPEHALELINVNLVGVLYCCQEFARSMVERREGKIINIASIAALVGRDRRMYEHEGMIEQSVDYAAAKAGVLGMTRDLAAVLSPHGINVNAISPGGFERGQPATFVAAYSDSTPLGRMGRDGWDLNGAALFLASPASDYVTGQNLVVDGGFSVCK